MRDGDAFTLMITNRSSLTVTPFYKADRIALIIYWPSTI